MEWKLQLVNIEADIFLHSVSTASNIVTFRIIFLSLVIHQCPKILGANNLALFFKFESCKILFVLIYREGSRFHSFRFDDHRQLHQRSLKWINPSLWERRVLRELFKVSNIDQLHFYRDDVNIFIIQ